MQHLGFQLFQFCCLATLKVFVSSKAQTKDSVVRLSACKSLHRTVQEVKVSSSVQIEVDVQQLPSF